MKGRITWPALSFGPVNLWNAPAFSGTPATGSDVRQARGPNLCLPHVDRRSDLRAQREATARRLVDLTRFR